MSLDALAIPLYEPADVARLAGLARGQASRWLFGYSYPYGDELRQQDPLGRRQLATRQSRRASFLDLVELRTAKLFLDHGLSAQKVRRAFWEAQRATNEPFPFASKRVFTLGPRIFLKVDHPDTKGGLLELLTGGQWAIEPMLRDYVQQLEFDESGLAETWWPMGPSVPVLITPRRAAGAPTVKTRNVKTSTLYDLYLAEGRHIEPVAHWYNLSPDEVAAAVTYEEKLQETKAA